MKAYGYNKKLRLRIMTSIVFSVYMIFQILVISDSLPTNASQDRAGNYNMSFSLSGNHALDIVNIAKAQLGKTGSNLGYTEEWCGDFVTDCARLTKMSDNIIPYNYSGRGSCDSLYQFMIKSCSAYNTTDPHPGDLIFFGSKSKLSHVAIVEYCSGSTIHWIGGNQGDGKTLYSRAVTRNNTASSTQHMVYVLRPNYNDLPVPCQIEFSGFQNPEEGYVHTPGANCGLYGTITSNHPLTHVWGGVYNMDGTKAPGQSTTCDDYPNSTSYSLRGTFNNSIIFDDIPVGSYYFSISAADNTGYEKELLHNEFTVGTSSPCSINITGFQNPEEGYVHTPGANCGLYGTITSSHPLTHVWGGVYNMDGAKAPGQSTTCDDYPNSTSYSLRGTFNNTVIFDDIPEGYYYFSLSAADNDGYETELIHNEFKVGNPPLIPSSSILSADKNAITIGESITFSASSDTAISYTIGIDKDDERIITQVMPDGKLTLTFDQEGSYSAYVSAYNTSGFCDSERIYFTVSNPVETTVITTTTTQTTTTPAEVTTVVTTIPTQKTLEVDETSLDLFVGGTSQIEANQENLIYKSDDLSIATVSEDGIITAVSQGEAIISVINSDYDVVQIAVTVTKITDVQYGDVNGDGTLDIMDVITINKYLLGSATLDATAKLASDVDGNGEINSTDSLIIIKCVVELISVAALPLR